MALLHLLRQNSLISLKINERASAVTLLPRVEGWNDFNLIFHNQRCNRWQSCKARKAKRSILLVAWQMWQMHGVHGVHGVHGAIVLI